MSGGQTVFILAAPPKSPHCVLREARSSAVHLEVAVATPQSAPSPLASTSPQYSPDPTHPRQAVRGFGRGLYCSTQGANSVVDVTFRSGVFVRDASCSLPVGRHVFLYLRGLALDVICTMQRLRGLSRVSAVHDHSSLPWSTKFSTLHFPRNIFAFVYQNILPKCLVRGLHSFFNGASCDFLCRFTAHPKILKFSSTGNLWPPFVV